MCKISWNIYKEKSKKIRQIRMKMETSCRLVLGWSCWSCTKRQCLLVRPDKQLRTTKTWIWTASYKCSRVSLAGGGTKTVCFKHTVINAIQHKVNRCLARYSPHVTTTNRPTNRALNKPAWPGPNWPKIPVLGQIWSFLGKKSFFLLEKSKVLLPT